MFTLRSKSHAFLASALLSAFAGSALGQTPTFHLIGALPGTNTFSSGYGVSEDGSVVVGHSGNNYYYGSSSHAFRWSDDTGIVDLDPLAPAAGAYGISSDGTIIVGGETSGSVKAVRWGGSTSGLTDQLYHGGECYGLSHDGNVAFGWSASGGGGGFRPHRAIRYSNSGHVEFIDTPTAGIVAPTNSESLAGNTDGSVIVGWGVFAGVQRAFIWTATGNMNVITPSAGIANGVSGDGSTVVGEFAVGSTRHAFRWTAAGGLVDLGTLPGMGYSTAYAISTDGSTIVGKSQVAVSSGEQRAFIWRADMGMQDLNVVLASVQPAGYLFTEARATNSTGSVIAGGSLTPTGGVEAWVATMPSCIPPSVAATPASIDANWGMTVDLKVSIGGVGPFTYQWRKDSHEITGAISSHLVISPATVADSGSYDCIVTGACGNITGGASTLTVHPVICKVNYISDTGCLGPTDLLGYLSLYFTNFDGQGSGVPGDDQTTPQINPASHIYAVPCTASAPGEFPVVTAAGLKADFDGDCQVGPTDLLGFLHDYFNPASECFGGCFAPAIAPTPTPAPKPQASGKGAITKSGQSIGSMR